VALEVDGDGSPVVPRDDGVDDDARCNLGKAIAWSIRSGASWNDEEVRSEVLGATARFSRGRLARFSAN
jgi:hypothetical protein